MTSILDKLKRWFNALASTPVSLTGPSPKSTIEWANIPAGTFMMGSPTSEAESQSDRNFTIGFRLVSPGKKWRMST